ncbi:MAG TPA: hypothetical protein VHZ98_06955 [Galbitalea sp.]|jgi:hypothetical protein|nr:hypothetical protein [Galbitalea sp.]
MTEITPTSWTVYYAGRSFAPITIEQVDNISEVVRETKDGKAQFFELTDIETGLRQRFWIAPGVAIAFGETQQPTIARD